MTKPYLHIPEQDLEWSFFRSSGPGGQKKNTTDSSVRLRHLPTNIVVVAQRSRSQHKNRELALEELRRRLLARRRRPKPRKATKPSRASKERRLQQKKQRAQKKAMRQSPPSQD